MSTKNQKRIEKCKNRISQIDKEIEKLNNEKKDKLDEIKLINEQELVEYVKSLKMPLDEIVSGIEFVKTLKNNNISADEAKEMLFDEKKTEVKENV